MLPDAGAAPALAHADATRRWPAGAKGWVITGGAAAVPGVPAAVFTLTTRAGQPGAAIAGIAMVIVVGGS